MNIHEQSRQSAMHALEVHLAAVIMFFETKWRRTNTNQARDAMVEEAVREGCDAVIRAAQDRRDNPLAHDYNPQ